MSNSTNRELVKFICYVFLAYLLDKSVKAVPGDYVDFILCRSCGHEILHPSAIIQVPSKVAHRQRNDTIAGRNGTLIQLFKNPDGAFFEVISATEANLTEVSKPSDLMTWFPGYHWTICVCPMCMKHVGWKYHATSPERKPQSFFGIILDNILQQSEAESIIHIPKAYTSWHGTVVLYV